MKCAVSLDISTQLLFTLDDREPTDDDHDFAADFDFPDDQETQVSEAVEQVAEIINTYGKPPPNTTPATVDINIAETGSVVVRVNGTEVGPTTEAH